MGQRVTERGGEREIACWLDALDASVRRALLKIKKKRWGQRNNYETKEKLLRNKVWFAIFKCFSCIFLGNCLIGLKSMKH